MESRQDAILRQYELMINSSIQLTSWRQSTNNYFLTVNTVLLAIATYLLTLSSTTGIAIGLAGIAIAILWHATIKYYKSLNKAKFMVIEEIEKQLPIAMFQMEYSHFKKEGVKKATNIECGIPWLFGFAYAVIVIMHIWKLVVA
jgi:hypothetical protein